MTALLVMATLISHLGGLQALGGSAAAQSDAIRRTYANALRHFRPRVTPKQASEVAEAIIRSSNRANLDARLVVAIVVEEGLLREVGTQEGRLVLNSRPGAEVLDALAKDIGDRLTAMARDGDVSRDSIEAALVARAERVKPGGRRGRGEARLYAARVMQLYDQLCGIDRDEDPPEPPRPP